MTEKYTWKWARQNNIPSVAILDQWQNYKERFSGPGGADVLEYLPTFICAMDESAKRGLTIDGVPEERIIITGQPSLARMRRCMLDGSHNERQAIRNQLHCGEDSLLMVFISEPFTSSMGQEIGFTEISILEELLSYLSDRVVMDEKIGKASSLQLIIKMHPKNRLDVFTPLEKRYKDIWGKLKIKVLKDEIGKDQLLQASDMILGMCSIMLMEAVALGKTVVSLQIGAKRRDWCEAVNQGIIPFIATSEDKTRLLDSLLDNEQFLSSYNELIRNYPVISDAEERIWSIIQDVRSKKIN
jgi:UDP-N-acetylglucosamine 2-epimerase